MIRVILMIVVFTLGSVMFFVREVNSKDFSEMKFEQDLKSIRDEVHFAKQQQICSDCEKKSKSSCAKCIYAPGLGKCFCGCFSREDYQGRCWYRACCCCVA